MIFTHSDEPLSVTLLLFPGLSLMSLAATLDPLRGANRVLGRPAYRWKLVSIDGAMPVASCGLPIQVDGAFDPAEEPGRAGGDRRLQCDRPRHAADIARAADRREALGHRRRHRDPARWLLGFAGLLDGRRATTHWEDLEDFAARFPNVDVQPDRWVVDEPVFTTGGATPALDCMLALIRARSGYSAALDVASLYIYGGGAHRLGCPAHRLAGAHPPARAARRRGRPHHGDAH